MKTFLILILIFLTTNVGKVNAAVPLDFDGDGKSDFAITRRRPAGSVSLIDWYIAKSSDNTLLHSQWGITDPTSSPSDFLRPADYDGDGKTDFAIYRPVSLPGGGSYYIHRSLDSTVEIVQFGVPTDDSTILGDYDGDGKADINVYRDTTSSADQNYYIYRGSLNNPNGNLTYIPWGRGFQQGTVKGDFDGDGKLDPCIRTNTGMFILRRSSDSVDEYVQWGVGSDQVFPGDYDGDGRTDFGVLRVASDFAYHWYILERDGGGTGANPIVWGRQDLSDTPVGGTDYDGDGISDITVYRNIPAGNIFFVRKSSDGSMLAYQWGSANAGDSPIRNF